METETPFKVNDSTGVYTSWRPVSADEILQQAKLILEERFKPGVSFRAPGDASEFLIAKLAALESEVFCVLFLDNRHQLIKFEEMFFGTIDGTSVYPREVVKKALGHNASALILAHNHPSGRPEPSNADERITSRLKGALELVDIRLLDHIIVGGTETVSMASRGLV